MPSPVIKIEREPAPRNPGRMVNLGQAVALVLAVAAVPLTSALDSWQLASFFIIAAFTVVSDLTAVRAGGNMMVSGSFLGIVLAAVTLGGGPAAILGAVTICVGWLRSREQKPYFVNNVVNYACFPLITGLAFHLLISTTGAGPRSLAFYVFVFAAFILALTLNFSGVAAFGCYLERSSFVGKAREFLVPVLSAELFSALLTVAAAYVSYNLGRMGLILFGLVLVIFQYLVGELLTSKRRSEELARNATTDELTGLANRQRFHTVVEERIAATRAAGSRFALMLMDLDRFKEINDALGHLYGDVLLRDFGPRLVSAIGDGGLVARLGGDEFGVLLAQDTDDPAVLDIVLTRLFKCISQPFSVDELSLEVGASVGVARFPQDGEDSHALLRCADIAMYSAKEAQTDYKIYTAEQNQHSVRRLSVLSDIRRALASDEIVVHYQPIIDLDDLRVRGAEGLVRWQHPEHGLIQPGAFVQTIEQTGLIGPLTRHVLEHSIAECASWRRDGRDMSVAVNLSVRNLLDRDLPKEIERLLDLYSLPANALQLEITESMIMSDPERALATVSRLSDLGARLSVDDFGTGYSSLANLRKMPIDELKIDRSFVSPMLRDESDLIIVRSTINLGHDLGLRIIAEGVEDGATLQQLAELGCDLAQGYHVSRPMPADAFSAWLTDSVEHGTPAVPTLGELSAPAAVVREAADLAGVTASARR
jgi:diguanylate cyclase (GGDEF)-like protein